MDLRGAINQLAYHLIYPAILGSIIFDLADPFRDLTPIRVAGFLIGVCFIVDYLHMTLNLCRDGSSPHRYGAIIDIVIAILFCISYFSLSKTTVPTFDSSLLKHHITLSLFFMLLAQSLIFLYDIFLMETKEYPFSLFSPVAVSGTGVILLTFDYFNDPMHILFYTLGTVLLVYSYRVFVFTRRKRKEEAIGNL